MVTKPYETFAKRLISTLKGQGYVSTRSPNGICIKTVAQIIGVSEQMCRRYIRGDALPDYEKLKLLAENLKVNAGWLLFGEEVHYVGGKISFDKILLHYILKRSYQLHRDAKSDDYADFVLELISKIAEIGTCIENSLKIVDVTIHSISAYKKTPNTRLLNDTVI